MDACIYNVHVRADTLVYVNRVIRIVYVNHEPMCSVVMGHIDCDFFTIKMEDDHDLSYDSTPTDTCISI